MKHLLLLFGLTYASLQSDITFAVIVAGCDEMRDSYCAILPKLSSLAYTYANPISVYTCTDSQEMLEAVRNRTRSNSRELEASIDAAIRAKQTEIRNLQTTISGLIAHELQLAQAVAGNIRASLKNRLQEILLEQTCENHIIPAIGTAGRPAQVRNQTNCIKARLNHWRGLNEEGRPLVATEAPSALTAPQIRQLLRMLEMLYVDPDLEPTQRNSIRAIRATFGFFYNR